MDSWTYWGPSSPHPPLFTFFSFFFPSPPLPSLWGNQRWGDALFSSTCGHQRHPAKKTQSEPSVGLNRTFLVFAEQRNLQLCCKKSPLIWCFFVAPTRGQHSLPYGGRCLFITSTGGADEEVNIDSVDVWTVWQVLTGRLEKKLREAVDQSEDSRCFHYEHYVH